jgi:uncharacterized membrane protein YbhN (UPF0104 family)
MNESPPDTSHGYSRWPRMLAPIVFYMLLLAFVAVTVATVDWSQLKGIEISWWPVMLATALSIAYRYLGVFIWFRLLHRLGATKLRGHHTELTYIYAKSWLGRYIPGAATWIVGKIYFAGQHGVPRSKLAVSGVLEGALQVVATLIVGSTIVLLDNRANTVAPWLRLIMIAALVVSVVVLIPPVFRRLLAFVFRVLRRGSPDPSLFPTWDTTLEATALYLVGALISGTSHFLVALSVYPDLPLTNALYLIGAASVASALSLLAVFAPGGVGVREATLVVLLAPVMPTAIAVVFVVLLRVWSIAVDFLFFVINWLLRGSHRPGAITTNTS